MSIYWIQLIPVLVCMLNDLADCQNTTTQSQVSCPVGYFWNGIDCRQKCHVAGCAQCSSPYECSQCISGHYRYGTDCLRCSYGCGYRCDKENGTCDTCHRHFTGDKCDTCIDGRYRSFCDGLCEPPCEACSSLTDCKSCVDGFFLQGKTCIRCKPGCAQCSTRDNCTRCIDGFYNSATRDCVACSTLCLIGTCRHDTGVCDGGCSSGYSGNMCCLNGSSCMTCSSASHCSVCLAGKYGEACDEDCPANCVDCIKDDGNCVRCVDGFQGDNCTAVTSTNTVSSRGGRNGAAIGGGVAGGLVVVIVILVVLLIVYRRRLARRSNDTNRKTDDIPIYINDPAVSANETQETAIQDKTRKLEKYQRKEVEYADKVARLQVELNEMRGPSNAGDIGLNETREPPNEQGIGLNEMMGPSNAGGVEDGARSRTESETYESLNPQDVGDHPYAALGTK